VGGGGGGGKGSTKASMVGPGVAWTRRTRRREKKAFLTDPNEMI